MLLVSDLVELYHRPLEEPLLEFDSLETSRAAVLEDTSDFVSFVVFFLRFWIGPISTFSAVEV